ncbi:hypothetical protein [Desulfosporosinus sp. FKA]|uniref:hypothetical protein n=1 Tax=Desulfosporosinus sp. FKA TaxID=1969834 RepID=UPI000B49FA47|nr:hypothetical protein [Desulfosporosinus sp. FKA]
MQDNEEKPLNLVDDDDDFTTCVEEYDQALRQVITESEANNSAATQKRSKTYLSSEIPVRPCTSECLHRDQCKDFMSGKVKDKELCRPELRQIKKWQVAFRKNDLESLKDDVGTVAGGMAVQVNRLLEAVIKDGVVVESEKLTNSGLRYTEKVAHPALREAAHIMKTLGIDMGSFLMTPKSAKDAGPQVHVNIGISADEVQARFAARYNQKLPEVKVISDE